MIECNLIVFKKSFRLLFKYFLDLEQSSIVGRIRNDVVEFVVVPFVTHLENDGLALEIFNYVFYQETIVYDLHTPCFCLLLFYEVGIVKYVVINTDGEHLLVEALQLDHILLVCAKVFLLSLDDSFGPLFVLRHILPINQIPANHYQRWYSKQIN